MHAIPQPLALLAGLAGFSLVTQAQLVSYSFTGAAGNEVSFAPDTVPAGLTASAMTRGSGLTGSANSGTFAAANFTTGVALDANDYFTFSLAPAAGMSLTLTRLELDERRSGTGIRNWSVRSSLDGFSQDLGAFSVPDDTNTRLNQTTALGAAFQDLAHPVEFRVYGFGAEAASGTWRLDNVEAYGGITPVPEPSSAALLAGAGLIAFAASRRWRAVA